MRDKRVVVHFLAIRLDGLRHGLLVHGEQGGFRRIGKTFLLGTAEGDDEIFLFD